MAPTVRVHVGPRSVTASGLSSSGGHRPVRRAAGRLPGALCGVLDHPGNSRSLVVTRQGSGLRPVPGSAPDGRVLKGPGVVRGLAAGVIGGAGRSWLGLRVVPSGFGGGFVPGLVLSSGGRVRLNRAWFRPAGCGRLLVPGPVPGWVPSRSGPT